MHRSEQQLTAKVADVVESVHRELFCHKGRGGSPRLGRSSLTSSSTLAMTAVGTGRHDDRLTPRMPAEEREATLEAREKAAALQEDGIRLYLAEEDA